MHQPGEKDKLSFSSLSYQISNGLKLGYSQEIVCAAVLKAISPGNNLRTYLESKVDLTITSLIEIMRSHFHEKDSTSVFTELSNASQDVNESCQDFVIRMMCLRQKVFVLGVEEDCPYDDTLVQNRFFHTIETGMRNNNIRSELREIFKESKVTDEELLKSVTEAVANETERNGKLSLKKKETLVNTVVVDTGESKKKKDNYLQIQIQEMKITHEQALSAMKIDLQEIKSALTRNSNYNSGNFPGNNSGNFPGNNSGNFPGNNSGNFPGNNSFSGSWNFSPRFQNKRKCKNCASAKNSYRCVHCFKCGSSEHRMANCTMVSNDQKN